MFYRSGSNIYQFTEIQTGSYTKFKTCKTPVIYQQTIANAANCNIQVSKKCLT